MEYVEQPQMEPKIARLLQNQRLIVPERPWCVLSGRHRFDGSVLEFAGERAAEAALRKQVRECADCANCAVVWTPLPRRQRGRIPRSLRCGYTIVEDGDDLVIFQSVVFEPQLGVIDVIATTRAGQFALVAIEKVSAWDGTPVDEPAPVAC